MTAILFVFEYSSTKYYACVIAYYTIFFYTIYITNNIEKKITSYSTKSEAIKVMKSVVNCQKNLIVLIISTRFHGIFIIISQPAG